MSDVTRLSEAATGGDRQAAADLLFHTSEDTVVPSENSTLFYMALRKNKVPAELHVYEKGRHGVGLATGEGGTPNDPVVTTWKDRLIDWMKGRGLMTK